MRVLIFVMVVGLLSFILYGNLPADAGEVNKTVKLASTSTEARAAVAKALLRTPNPTRFELASIDDDVEGIIVTETARAATGDKSLLTPAEKKRIYAQKQSDLKKDFDYKVKIAKSKSLSEMTFEDYSVLYMSYQNLMIAIVGIVIVATGVLRAFSKR